jgi:hypothetical protein
VSAQNKLLKGIILDKDENLREYGMRILGIVRDASVVGTQDETIEDWATSYFLDGIKNRNIRTSLVLLRDSLGFFQLIDKAAALEDAEHSHMPSWNDNRNSNAFPINKPWNNINLENDGNENCEQKPRMNVKRNGWNNANQQPLGRGNAMVGNPLKSKDGRMWSKSILREIWDAGLEECEKELIQVTDSERSKMEMHRNTNPTIGCVKFKQNESQVLSEHCKMMNDCKATQMLMIVNESEIGNEENKSSKARLSSYCTEDAAYPWKPGESKIVHKPREKSSLKSRSTRPNPKFLPKGQSNRFGPDSYYDEHGCCSSRRPGRSHCCPSDSRLLPAHDGCSSTLAADADVIKNNRRVEPPQKDAML